MFRLYMNVMLNVLNEWLIFYLKRKNRQLSERLFKKPGSLQCFSFGLEGFFQDLEFGFFRIWTGSFGFGFQTRPLVSLRIGSVISFGLDISKV